VRQQTVGLGLGSHGGADGVTGAECVSEDAEADVACCAGYED
jgi:hypothetical protein